MVYLTGCLPAKQHLREALERHGIGLLATPYSQRLVPDQWIWAADNGCFGCKWDEQTWLRWLDSKPRTALFATVPDVVASHIETVKRWNRYGNLVRGMGFKAGFVLQDGARELPWDEMDALFVGGSTEYKLSEEAHNFVQEAKQRGKWVHMGRVNSKRRIAIAREWGCDSVDGTFLAFGPDINTPKLIKMMEPDLQLSLFKDSRI